MEVKVGIISCSGEEIPEGTISRIATRMVLEKLRPDETVTICLPLFLAGGEEERQFAQNFPTIAVDGCEKMCAKLATEKYSGKTDGVIVVSDFLKNHGIKTPDKRRNFTEEEMKIAEKVAEEIGKRVDEILKRG
ncbi:MAG: putative zinc-binding protein [Proteobacteria bacterium]|nr:putative zinc-binding protein [Pseudomonadota bacterium]